MGNKPRSKPVELPQNLIEMIDVLTNHVDLDKVKQICDYVLTDVFDDSVDEIPGTPGSFIVAVHVAMALRKICLYGANDQALATNIILDIEALETLIKER
jgi:hypothetical protein